MAHIGEWLDQHWNHHDQETPVTAPQPRTMLSDLAAIAAELHANALVEQLAERRLGAQLNAEQRHTVVVLVASLEAENGQPLPQRTVQPAAGLVPQVAG